MKKALRSRYVCPLVEAVRAIRPVPTSGATPRVEPDCLLDPHAPNPATANETPAYKHAIRRAALIDAMAILLSSPKDDVSRMNKQRRGRDNRAARERRATRVDVAVHIE